MKRSILRKRNGRFCRLEIELENGRLSVCGSEGRIVRRTRAKKEALAYWRSYFEDDPGAIMEMNKRCGTRFSSASGAARYVLSVDGDLHGLDVLNEEGNEILVLESCGQIRDEIAEWFPEVVPLLKWHLNDMQPGCEHQERDGWADRPIDPTKSTDTYGKHFPGQQNSSWNMLVWVRPDEFPGGLLCAPCPECGYKYGSAWLKRDLPAEIVKLAETVAA